MIQCVVIIMLHLRIYEHFDLFSPMYLVFGLISLLKMKYEIFNFCFCSLINDK